VQGPIFTVEVEAVEVQVLDDPKGDVGRRYTLDEEVDGLAKATANRLATALRFVPSVLVESWGCPFMNVLHESRRCEAVSDTWRPEPCSHRSKMSSQSLFRDVHVEACVGALTTRVRAHVSPACRRSEAMKCALKASASGPVSTDSSTLIRSSIRALSFGRQVRFSSSSDFILGLHDLVG
jgi:hypothetical protein